MVATFIFVQMTGWSSCVVNNRHLLLGQVICHECGGSIALVNGKRYGCTLHQQRSNEICTNNARFGKNLAEERIIEDLRNMYLSQENREHAFKAAMDEFNAIMEPMKPHRLWPI